MPDVKILSPMEAATAAKAVYKTRESGKQNGLSIGEAFADVKISNYFDLKEGDNGSASRFSTTTGAKGIFKHQTSSEFANGKAAGFEKHSVLICRGTEGGMIGLRI